ncbi:MFS general substrate transporter [Neolentinus lepideus HHB14362 ss-1]|uniref:MFS general substrate transporter n=1 Tax=Neolentinus lepideus HHB14362 ss-1 TaxID=1314782 RepID=A0A165RIP5_9AGAM|nr:MFS general substrate transporter [Neolentinus lepideus HHB14362 ss-1]
MSGYPEPDSDSETQALLRVAGSETVKPYSSGISPVTLISPVVLVYRLATILPSTTTFFVVNQFACRLWYTLNDPGSIPSDGGLSTEQCSIPGVQKTFAAIFTAISISDGLGSVIGYSAASLFASRYGRKPVTLVLITIAMGHGLSLVSSTFASGWFELIFLCTWILCGSFAQPPVFGFAANMFIVDLVSAEERTATISKLNGWSVFGGAISFTVGGAITTRFHNVLVVYYLSAAMFASIWVYVFLLIPESFSKEKRDELRRQRKAKAQEAEVSVAGSRLDKAKHYLIRTVVPEPLKEFKPTRNPVTGKRNWRLFYCAVHIIFTQLADAYGAVSMVLFLTAKHNYEPSETGYVLTTLSLVDVFCLTLIIPLLVRRILRPYHLRAKPIRTSSRGGEISETSDRLDVHIAVASWTINAIAYILLGYMNTRITQILAIILLGFGCGGGPVARSLVVATVHPLKQGDALGAVEMVSSLGTFLSPIVMGTILTSTISTFPQLVFWVHGAIVVAASMVLFLVRDSDRYQEEDDHED